MARFATLNSPSLAIRRQLQAVLYYNRKRRKAVVAETSNPLLDPAGWTTSVNGGTGTASVSAGTLTLAGDGTNAAQADQSLTLIPGRSYKLSGQIATNAVSLSIGSTQGADDIVVAASRGVGDLRVTFTARAVTWIRFARTSTGDSVISSLLLIEGS